MSAAVVVGVDGGGTHSKLVAVRMDGSVIASAEGAGVNYHAIGMEAARENLFAGVRNLMQNLSDTRCEMICVGMSALDQPAEDALLKEFAGARFEWQRLFMDSDVYMALMGATLGLPGIMVVSGTGSMIVAQDARGEVLTAGGWGYRLDDPGSAYGVAVDSLKAAMMSMEGLRARTLLAEAALRFFDAAGSRDLIVRMYDGKIAPSDIARFAQSTLACADSGDETAKEILDNHMAMLAELTAPLLRRCPEGTGVNLYGGMFEHNPRVVAMYDEKLRARGWNVALSFPQLPPELGAVVAYFRRTGRLTDEMIGRMKRTWRKDAL